MPTGGFEMALVITAGGLSPRRGDKQPRMGDKHCAARGAITSTAPASHWGVVLGLFSLMTPDWRRGLFVPPPGEQACVSKPWGRCVGPVWLNLPPWPPGDPMSTGRFEMIVGFLVDAPLAALAGGRSPRRGNKQPRGWDRQCIGLFWCAVPP